RSARRHQTKFARLGQTAKPRAASSRSRRARVARIFARIVRKYSWSSRAAVAAARLSTSQLYESLTLFSSRTSAGAATAKPKGTPARAYDLLNERVTTSGAGPFAD